jgi:excinuclease ABC subunit B
VLADLEAKMRTAAADLDFEEAARLRDELKRLRATEMAVVDDPTAKVVRLPVKGSPASARSAKAGPRKPTLDEMGPGMESKLFRPGAASPRSTTGKPGQHGGWKPKRHSRGGFRGRRRSAKLRIGFVRFAAGVLVPCR